RFSRVGADLEALGRRMVACEFISITTDNPGRPAMSKLLMAAVTTSCALLLLVTASAEAKNIIAWGTMYAVDGPFLGSANAIRGVNGDTEAWVLKKVSGHLTTKGQIEVEVKGLIFKDGDPNDESVFKAVVSCLTENGDATPVVNVPTRGFPASGSGDSHIKDK